MNKVEWDDPKAAANLRKHGVSFEDAQQVFMDTDGILLGDPDHSDDEERFLLLGADFQMRILVVVHCYREPDDVIRIVSARKATRREQATYNKGLQ